MADIKKKRRGCVGAVLELGWGGDGINIFSDRKDISDCPLYDAEAVNAVCDMLLSAEKVIISRPSGSVAATSVFGRARHGGVCGNRLAVSVTAMSGDLTPVYKVVTFIDGEAADTQTVLSIDEIVDSEYVIFDRETELFPTAGVPFTGGCDSEVSDMEYENALRAFDGVTLDILASAEKSSVKQNIFGEYILSRRAAGDAVYGIASFECGGGVSRVYCRGGDTSGAVHFISGAYAAILPFEMPCGIKYRGAFDVPFYDDEFSAKKDLSLGIVLVKRDDGIYIYGDGALTHEKKADDAIYRTILNIYNESFRGAVPSDGVGRAKLKGALCDILGENVLSVSVFSDENGDISVSAVKRNIPRVYGITVEALGA